METARVQRFADFIDGLTLPTGSAAPQPTPPAGGLAPHTVRWGLAASRACAESLLPTMGDSGGRADPETWTVRELLEPETRRSIDRQVLSLLRYVHGEQGSVRQPPELFSLAVQLARLEIPYERYLEGQRIVQRTMVERLLAAWSSAPGLLPAHVVPHLIALVTTFFDKASLAVLDEYLAERERVISQTLAMRRRMLHDIIAGQRVDEAVAGEVLQVDLRRHHVALVLWSDPGVRSSPGRVGRRAQLEVVAESITRATRAADVMWLPSETEPFTLWCWVSRDTAFPPDIESVVQRALARFPGIRVALGQQGSGIGGFRRSHLTALDVSVVARSGGTAAVTSLDDVGVLALLLADPERARWFVEYVLGPLGRPEDPALADLRQTALCYLELGHNLVRTATALHVHRNTVVYRLHSVENLLGRPLSDRPLAVHAALNLQRVLDDV